MRISYRAGKYGACGNVSLRS
ncbi:hypothetical protein WDK43_25870 [Escherichia coli]|nr:hypothetical protein [Escherichia coli]MDG5616317.1 hypothetical protein [Escherichia coli]